MKALVLSAPGKIEIKTLENPAPGPGQALVRIMTASLNHRDQWCREGKYPKIEYGTILGSDGFGIVEAVSEPSQEALLGKEVVINPNIQWGSNPKAQSSDYKILGMPDNGTFAKYVVVGVDRLHAKPTHLDAVGAAALPLGGLTAFRAVFRQGKVTAGKNVLISGIGGGVAQFAFLFSVASGANVFVTSSSTEKIKQATERGAINGFDYKKEEWFKEALKATGGFDVIIDSAGGDQMNALIKTVKSGGRIVFYGATTGVPSSLDLRRIFWNQITLQGSTMGNDEEFKEMLDFVTDHKIAPIVDSVRPFNEIISAFDVMKSGKQFGKLVVEF